MEQQPNINFAKRTEPLVPITIPPEPDWTIEKDLKAVEEILGEEWELDDLLIRTFDALRDLAKALQDMLRYFGDDRKFGIHCDIPELIFRVEKHVRERAKSQQVVDWFLEYLAKCRFVFDQFERVIGAYVAEPTLRWLFPLADLGDWIVSATIPFDEFLRFKSDYFSPKPDKSIP